jgi:hypothetical protein
MTTVYSRRLSRLALLARVTLLALVALGISTGCVRRRLTIRSTPPGARVLIDDQEIGVTPASTPFTYYGTRKVQLIKDGYETLTVQNTISPPWYEYPPLDFFSESLWPHEIRDERQLDFQLIPQQNVPPQELRARAEALRGQAWQGQAVPLPPRGTGSR